MKRQTVLLGLSFGLSLSSLLLCGYIAPQDRKYLDYFLKKYSAELFRDKNFILVSSSYYVGRKNIEKVEMAFSFCRPIPKNFGRQMIVDMSEALINAINNDPELKKRGLLSKPFTSDRLVFELRTDNIWSANVDVESCQTITLADNQISYKTFKWSTILSAGKDCSVEEYQYARMLCGKPTAYTSEAEPGYPEFPVVAVPEVVEKVQEPVKIIPQTMFVGAFDAFRSTQAPYSSTLGDIEWITFTPVEVVLPKKQSVIEETGDNFNFLFPKTDTTKTLRGRIKAGEQTIWKEAAPGAFTSQANESKKELVAVLDESQLDAISLALGGSPQGYLQFEDASHFNEESGCLQDKSICSISYSTLPTGSYKEAQKIAELMLLHDTAFPVEQSRNEAYKDLVAYSYLPQPTENATRIESQIDDSKDAFYSSPKTYSKAIGEVESSFQSHDPAYNKTQSELSYQFLPQNAPKVHGLVAIEDGSSIQSFEVAQVRVQSDFPNQAFTQDEENTASNRKVLVESDSALGTTPSDVVKKQSLVVYQDIPQASVTSGVKVALESSSALESMDPRSSKEKSAIAYQSLPQSSAVANGKVVIEESSSSLRSSEKSVVKNKSDLVYQALPQTSSATRSKVAIESNSTMIATSRPVEADIQRRLIATSDMPKGSVSQANDSYSSQAIIIDETVLEDSQKSINQKNSNQKDQNSQSLPITTSEEPLSDTQPVNTQPGGVMQKSAERHAQAVRTFAVVSGYQLHDNADTAKSFVATADYDSEGKLSQKMDDKVVESTISDDKMSQEASTPSSPSFFQKLKNFFGGSQEEVQPVAPKEEMQKETPKEISEEIPVSDDQITQDATQPHQSESIQPQLIADVELQEMPMDLPILPSDATEEVPTGMLQLDPEEENTIENEFPNDTVESHETTPESYLGDKSKKVEIVEEVDESTPSQEPAKNPTQDDKEVSLSLGRRLLSWLGGSKDTTQEMQIEPAQSNTDESDASLELDKETTQEDIVEVSVAESSLEEISFKSDKNNTERASTEPEEVQETIHF